MSEGVKKSAVFVLLGRALLGGLFLYMGLHKAFLPVEFLKLLREYGLTENALVLNLIAATLPWFEIFTGLLLLLGIGVQSAGLLIVAMLIPFTAVIARRAAGIHDAQGLPFCGIRFDCGCGAGEVLICRKLLENSVLILIGFVLVFVRSPLLALRYNLFRA